MKSNVIMTLKMGEFDVLQRTQDGMFNATELLSQWNKKSGQQKQISHYFELSNTKEFITALELEIDLNNGITFFKSRGKYNGGTWMSPLLFIDFAMWLNAKFKVQVLKFVYDELIKNRHIAGDNYRLLAASASKFRGIDYVNIAKGLNWIVFNKHYKDIRNTATDEQLNELHQIEQHLTFAIDMGLIKSYNELISTLRQMYNQKYQKF